VIRGSDHRRSVLGDMSIAHPPPVISSSYKISSVIHSLSTVLRRFLRQLCHILIKRQSSLAGSNINYIGSILGVNFALFCAHFCLPLGLPAFLLSPSWDSLSILKLSSEGGLPTFDCVSRRGAPCLPEALARRGTPCL